MTDNIFYDRLLEIISKSGRSCNFVERELGYPRNSLHNYRYGASPSAIRLIELSQYLGVYPEYLIGKTDISCSIESRAFLNH